jgi:hypothetical protein
MISSSGMDSKNQKTHIPVIIAEIISGLYSLYILSPSSSSRTHDATPCSSVLLSKTLSSFIFRYELSDFFSHFRSLE